MYRYLDEEYGRPRCMFSTEVGWITEDRDVISFWNDNVCVTDGHYQFPIPWKNDVLNNNYDVASSRLKSLN